MHGKKSNSRNRVFPKLVFMLQGRHGARLSRDRKDFQGVRDIPQGRASYFQSSAGSQTEKEFLPRASAFGENRGFAVKKFRCKKETTTSWLSKTGDHVVPF
jgi:hypothetical protein